MGIIYCAQNRVNQKYYVGQTLLTLGKRKTYHKGYAKAGDQRPFPRAIGKYGFDNFDWYILANAENQHELNELEKYWIKELETVNPEYGYNLCEGGRPSGKLISIQKREEIRKKYTGKGNPFYGRIHSEETRIQISRTKKGNSPCWNKGKILGPQSQEHIEKRRKAIIGLKRSSEAKARMSKAQKGRIISVEHRRKIGLTSLGRIPNEYVRQKLSIAAKRQWANEDMRMKIIEAQKRGQEVRRGLYFATNA